MIPLPVMTTEGTDAWAPAAIRDALLRTANRPEASACVRSAGATHCELVRLKRVRQ
jgi:hypothetical protein